jgi:hypothetical protein
VVEPAVASGREDVPRRSARFADLLRVAVRRFPVSLVVVTACVLGAAGLAGYYSTRVTAWAVMTDELQVVRLATSIAETLSPIPTIHGVYYGAHSQLYPLLLAPFYGTLTAPAAATAAHTLNALLLASAAWPAYLLARSASGSRGAGYAAAALVAFTPWLVLASTLLTENAAYAAFVWAVFLCHRALAVPSDARDVAALAGLLLAFLARTQLIVLAIALPLALVLHEVGFAERRRDGSRRLAIRADLLRMVRDHRVLTGFYAAGALASVLLLVAGSLGGVVGNYATPFKGDLIPSGFWPSAVAHFDQVAIGAGIAPVALSVSWVLTTAVRPHRKEAHAYAALFAVLVPLLTFEVTSFDLRFTPEQFIQDRYLFYLVPLFAVGTAAWLVQRTELKLRLVTLAASGAALAALVVFGTYDDPTIAFWASPAAAFHPALEVGAGWIGLSTAALLPLVTGVAVGIVALGAWKLPRCTAVGATVAIAAFGAFQARYVFDRHADPAMTRPHGKVPRDWIDAAVPEGRSVALVPSAYGPSTSWWEAELWNKTVDRVLKVGQGPTFTPFPVDKVSVDFGAGILTSERPSDYLVVTERETRFHVSRSKEIAKRRPLRLLRVRHPYRLDWAMRGVTADGWTRPRRLSTLRLYGHARPVKQVVVVTLAASQVSPRPVDFALRSGRAAVFGRVDPGGARPPIRLPICVPAGSHVDVWLTTNGHVRIPDGRVVGLHMEQLEVNDAGTCTAPVP